MTRSERLLALLQLLRAHRYPISAQILADKLAISKRTLYRDIASLRAQGVDIAGEAGMGYVLLSDNLLPPLMFSAEEMHAIVLGLRWVKRHADDSLMEVSNHAMAKIESVLPENLQQELLSSPLLVASAHQYSPLESEHANQLRQAMNQQLKVALTYQDGQEIVSKRIIYPLAIGFLQDKQLIASWCELRQDFRHFRLDRIISLEVLSETYQPNRQFLLKRWHKEQNIPLQ